MKEDKRRDKEFDNIIHFYYLLHNTSRYVHSHFLRITIYYCKRKKIYIIEIGIIQLPEWYNNIHSITGTVKIIERWKIMSPKFQISH